MSLRSLVALALALAVAPASGASAQSGDAPRRETFEEFLERVRAQRDASHARLRSDVEERLARLAAADASPRTPDLERALSDVVALGTEAVPLLVPHLDPGTPAEARAVELARRVAEALARMDTAAVTEPLLAALRTFGEEGRRNVLRVLETTAEPERVRPGVAELFAASHGGLKGAALRALFALGAARDEAFVERVLLGPDADLTRLSLRALADGRQPALLDAAGTLMSDPKRAGPLLAELALYLRAVASSLRDKDVLVFASLATANELETERRVVVLDQLSSLVDKASPELRKILELASEARDRKVREAAYVARVCLGDRGARRELLLEYDDRVKRNERWAPAWGERAAILYRIRDYDAAVKDYTTAIAVGKNDPTPRPEYYVGSARCYAMLGKLKEAAEWLERAPITFEELRSLGDDPVFAKLREHSRYGAVFGSR